METRRMSTRYAEDNPPEQQGVVIEPYRGPERVVPVHFPTSVEQPDADAAPAEPPAEVHWPADDGKAVDTVNWAWIGIAIQFGIIPAWLMIGLINIALIYINFTIPIVFIIAAISVIGLLFSLRSLISVRRSPQPLVDALLSLIGIGIAMFVLLYIFPGLLQINPDLINHPFAMKGWIH